MNEGLVDLQKKGLEGLRQFAAGKYLRLAEFALTMVVVAAYPKEAAEVVLDDAKQSRWEVTHG